MALEFFAHVYEHPHVMEGDPLEAFEAFEAKEAKKMLGSLF